MYLVQHDIKREKTSIFLEDGPSQHKRNISNVFRLWRTTINFLYYFGAIPFKCEYCQARQHWYLKTSKFQKVRSLIMTWIPMFLNEFGVVIAEIKEHSALETPNAKSYLLILTKLIAKVLFLMMFQATFLHSVEVMDMLSQILKASLELEHYTNKLINRAQKLLYIYVGFLLMCRITVHVIWFIKLIIPDQHKLETFQLKLYKILLTRFRNRFFMHASSSFTYTSADYVFAVYEAWLLNISALVWIYLDVILAAVLPVTFQIIVRTFQEVIHSNNLNSSKSDSNTVAVLEICRLFGLLKVMSESINRVWGNICLVLVLYRSTTYAVNMNGWQETEDIVVIIETTLPFVSLCLLLYFSGDVYCKVEYFKYWLTEENNWTMFITDQESSELKRILILHDSSCVGIGKTGLYRLTYSFSAQVFIVGITIFVISFDN